MKDITGTNEVEESAPSTFSKENKAISKGRGRPKKKTAKREAIEQVAKMVERPEPVQALPSTIPVVRSNALKDGEAPKGKFTTIFNPITEVTELRWISA